MKKYLIITIVCSLTVLTTLAGLNFMLDPLLLYPHQTIKPVDAKRQLINFARAHKSAQLEYLQPELIVLGSSRAFDGLDVTHPYLRQTYAGSYNAALYNATVDEMFALFNQARCHKKLKTVVIGLDFFVFNAQRPQFQQGGGSDFLNQHSCYAAKLNIVKSLFNFNNLRLEKFLNDRKQPVKQDVLPDGSLAVESSAEQRKNPLAAALLSEKNYLHLDGFYKDYSFSEQALAVVATMLEIAKQEGIEVKIFISPSHVRRWEVLDFAVGMAEFELFKTKLTQLVSQYDQSAGIQLWDFAVYHEFTTEAMTEQPLQWHWESSHYKKNLGAEVIQRIFDLPAQQTNFGVRLTPDNLNSHLQHQRQARQHWLQARPAEITELRQNLQSTPTKHK